MCLLLLCIKQIKHTKFIMKNEGRLIEWWIHDYIFVETRRPLYHGVSFTICKFLKIKFLK